MTIRHISFSSTGGAGKVAQLLCQEQIRTGKKSEFHHLTDTNLWQQPFNNLELTLIAGLDHYLISNGKYPTQLSALRSRYSKKILSEINKDDIIHLHWVSGVMAMDEIVKFSKKVSKVIWTLHDMEPFSGGCHHSNGCHGFESNCNNCPQIRPGFRQIAKSNMIRKTEAFKKIENLEIVAPSQWILDKATKSKSFEGRVISQISNPISDVFFENKITTDKAKLDLKIPKKSFVAIFIAADLDNPNKLVKKSLETFLNGNSHAAKFPRHAIVVGKSKHDFSTIPDVSYLGEISSEQLSHVGRAADLNISMAFADTAPLTTIEMAALGVPTIGRRGTGQESLIQDGATGFLINELNQMEKVIRTLETNETFLKDIRKTLKSQARTTYKLSSIAKAYETLYDEKVLK